mmetsp:Transcript_12380/g.43617  ORF Transcript_12380/g.43617 Transcript_12380/m.43617 type:complete len:280 (+) Transcript_12380:299-1138(+)
MPPGSRKTRSIGMCSQSALSAVNGRSALLSHVAALSTGSPCNNRALIPEPCGAYSVPLTAPTSRAAQSANDRSFCGVAWRGTSISKTSTPTCRSNQDAASEKVAMSRSKPTSTPRPCPASPCANIEALPSPSPKNRSSTDRTSGRPAMQCSARPSSLLLVTVAPFPAGKEPQCDVQCGVSYISLQERPSSSQPTAMQSISDCLTSRKQSLTPSSTPQHLASVKMLSKQVEPGLQQVSYVNPLGGCQQFKNWPMVIPASRSTTADLVTSPATRKVSSSAA